MLLTNTTSGIIRLAIVWKCISYWSAAMPYGNAMAMLWAVLLWLIYAASASSITSI